MYSRRARSGSHAVTRRALAALLSTVLLAFLAPAATGAPPAQPNRDRPAAASTKGPVGWDTYRELGQADQLRRGGQIRQSASYDRAGGNDDGFVGTHSCLRTTDDGCVIAEAEGAGEVQSIWFTRFSKGVAGDVSDTGDIRIELDGDTVLDAPLQDVVSGKEGAPFSWPLVGNADDTAGGAVIKVPMPYRESMKITVTNNPLFHHVTYRSFADPLGVTRFDPNDQALDVLQRLRGFGVTDPKAERPGAVTKKAALDVPAGQSSTVARVDGPGRISQLRLRLPQVLRSPGHRDDGRSFGSGGKSTFEARVDPDNTGVRLTRRYDPAVGDQNSRVLVDGQPAGEWKTGAAQGADRWADQSLEVPAALTEGKKKITVSHEFVSSDEDISEFRYDVASKVDGDWTRTDVLDLGPAHPGEEASHQYAITKETWKGTRTSRYPLTDAQQQQLKDSDDLLADARVRITFDGERTVDAPIGEFFGSGLGEYDVRSLMFSMDTTEDGWYTAWWPMPFAQSAVVEIVNRSGHPIKDGAAELTSAADPSVAARLGPQGDLGYFHATGQRAHTVKGRDWVFLETAGRGVYYGATQSMRGLITSGNRRNYLEGDERVYVDGELSPSMYGTGTEDYYESGWYFRDGTTFSMPMVGNPGYEKDGDGCAYDCTGTYRLQLGDAVSFGSGMRFGIEHGPASDEPGDYSSTAYWYGQRTSAMRHSDSVSVTGAQSRDAHRYSADGESTDTLSSTFEGEDDGVRYTSDVTAASGAVSFRTEVAATNTGVRLTRLSDQAKGYQRAEVAVDGKPVGTWATTLANGSSRWLQDHFEIPAEFTAGKSAVTVTLTPADGSPPWSAARYEVDSHVPPFTDGAAPQAITGVKATGDGTNAIDLQWDPAQDDVGAQTYQVYGSTDPSVPISSETLLGETRHIAFRHDQLGLEEKWHYRVRAIDGAGREGALSETASGTSGNALVHEGENLLPAVSADAPVEAQGNCCAVVWSGNAQMWFRATDTGQKVTLAFTVPEDGQYDFATVQTRAGDYGNVDFALDGQRVGETFNGYDTKVSKTDLIPLGSHSLTKGTHQLTLTVNGKDDSSTGYLAGTDLIRLTKKG